MAVEGLADFWWAPQDAGKAEKMLQLVLLSFLVALGLFGHCIALHIVLGSEEMEEKV